MFLIFVQNRGEDTALPIGAVRSHSVDVVGAIAHRFYATRSTQRIIIVEPSVSGDWGHYLLAHRERLLELRAFREWMTSRPARVDQ